MGEKRGPYISWNNERRKELRALWKNPAYRISDIAKLMKLSAPQVSNMAQSMGLPGRRKLLADWREKLVSAAQ